MVRRILPQHGKSINIYTFFSQNLLGPQSRALSFKLSLYSPFVESHHRRSLSRAWRHPSTTHLCVRLRHIIYSDHSRSTHHIRSPWCVVLAIHSMCSTSMIKPRRQEPRSSDEERNGDEQTLSSSSEHECPREVKAQTKEIAYHVHTLWKMGYSSHLRCVGVLRGEERSVEVKRRPKGPKRMKQ